MQMFDHVSIEALNLPKRIHHALARSGILTIGSLRQFCLHKNAKQIHMIGEKSLSEISKALEELHKNPTLLALAEKEPVQLNYQKDQQAKKTIQSPIDVLNLPAAIRGMLKKHGINTVDDLRKTPNPKLLKINLIGPKKLMEINHLLDEFVDNLEMLVVNEPVLRTERKFIPWSQVVEGYFRNEKDVYTYVLISRFGYTPKKLEEIAKELGITRERVRQIQEGVVVRYLKHLRFSGAVELLGKIEDIFSMHGEDLSLSSLKIILKREGVLGEFSETITTRHIEKLDLLETLICWLNLLSNEKYTLHPIEFSVDISNLAKSGQISIRDHATLMNISKRERRKIRRQVLFTGGITIKEASRILSKDERVTALVLKNLNLQKINNDWYSFKHLAQDNSKIPLRIAGLKMLAINPVMEINSFHDGLRRHAGRFYTSIAPIHVIEHILPMLVLQRDFMVLRDFGWYYETLRLRWIEL